MEVDTIPKWKLKTSGGSMMDTDEDAPFHLEFLSDIQLSPSHINPDLTLPQTLKPSRKRRSTSP
jgi:hypothetical protein